MNKAKLMALPIALLGLGFLINGNSVQANKHRDGVSVEKHVKELKSKLDLDSTQEMRVREIVENKMQKKMEATEAAHDEIRNLLSDEQKEKFNQWVAEKERD